MPQLRTASHVRGAQGHARGNRHHRRRGRGRRPRPPVSPSRAHRHAPPSRTRLRLPRVRRDVPDRVMHGGRGPRFPAAAARALLALARPPAGLSDSASDTQESRRIRPSRSTRSTPWASTTPRIGGGQVRRVQPQQVGVAGDMAAHYFVVGRSLPTASTPESSTTMRDWRR